MTKYKNQDYIGRVLTVVCVLIIYYILIKKEPVTLEIIAVGVIIATIYHFLFALGSKLFKRNSGS